MPQLYKGIINILWTIILQNIGQPNKKGHISKNLKSSKIELGVS